MKDLPFVTTLHGILFCHWKFKMVYSKFPILYRTVSVLVLRLLKSYEFNQIRLNPVPLFSASILFIKEQINILLIFQELN